MATITAGSRSPDGLAFALVDVDSVTGALSNFRFQNLSTDPVTVGFTNRTGSVILLPATVLAPGTALRVTPILQAPQPNDDFGTWLRIG